MDGGKTALVTRRLSAGRYHSEWIFRGIKLLAEPGLFGNISQMDDASPHLVTTAGAARVLTPQHRIVGVREDTRLQCQVLNHTHYISTWLYIHATCIQVPVAR